MYQEFDPEQFRINPAQGNDAGILICEACGISISPVLFMQAVCPPNFPLPQRVPWQSSAPLPKAFAAQQALPILYGEAGRVTPSPAFLHLYSLSEPAVKPARKATQLADWKFPVPIRGAVVLFEFKYDRVASESLWVRLGITPSKNEMLAWIQKQKIPYVVGAMGYADREFLELKFRVLYDIPHNVPILDGAPPADAGAKRPKKKQTASASAFSGVFERTQVVLDADYCKRVLGVLTAMSQWKHAPDAA